MQVENSRMIYRGADGLARAYRGDHIIVWEPGEHDYSKDYLTLRCIATSNANTKYMLINVYGSPQYMYARMIRNGSSYIPESTEMVGFTDIGGGWLRHTGASQCKLPFLMGDRILLKGLDGQVRFDSGAAVRVYEVYGSLTKSFNLNMDFTEMFFSEDGLISAENLIITPGADCVRMFSGCYSLEKPPKLPSYVNDTDYSYMFEYCEKMEAAPDIPYSQLPSGKFQGMFSDCTKLNYVKCLATQVWQNATTAWLSNVASTGTFVKSPNMSSWPSGVSGIPSGWTVVDAT